MKKMFVLMSILVCLLLVTPTSVALAEGKGKGKPVDFSAVMAVMGATEGNVTPIPPSAEPGANKRWLVRDRAVLGSVSGHINGGFTVVYDANVDLNQAGSIHGTINFNSGPAGIIDGVLRGRTLPGDPVDISYEYYLLPYLVPSLPDYLQQYLAFLNSVGYTFAVLPIGFDGSVTLQSGTGIYEGVQGTAKCDGVMANTIIAVAPGSMGGHVVALMPSDMTLSGKWHKN